MKTEPPVSVLMELECGHSLITTISYVVKTEYCAECRCPRLIAGIKTQDQILSFYEKQL